MMPVEDLIIVVFSEFLSVLGVKFKAFLSLFHGNYAVATVIVGDAVPFTFPIEVLVNLLVLVFLFNFFLRLKQVLNPLKHNSQRIFYSIQFH